MSKRNSHEEPNALPMPIVLTPQQAERIAAGTAKALPSVSSEEGGGGTTTGAKPPVKLNPVPM
jgi:hypothetical protein